MDEIIHFRSKYSREKSIGNASRYISGRSSEASEIRMALPDDDARDIVWSKSTGHTLITRNRLINSKIDVHFVLSPDDFDQKKWQSAEEIRAIVERSCRFRSDTFSFSEWDREKIEKGIVPGIKNTLTIILLSSIEKNVYKKFINIFQGNDIIFLMLFHPYEIENNGGKTPIFLSHIPSNSYYREVTVRIGNIQKTLNSQAVSNILLTSPNNIALKLNHFFKHRYG